MTKDKAIKEGAMKHLKVCLLLLFLALMLSCTGSTGPVRLEGTEGVQAGRAQAVKFDEVQLITSNGDIHRGKIIGQEGGSIDFRPVPYWDVELIRLNLDEIQSIELVNRPSRAGKGFIQGFGWTFTIVGGIAGIGSKYDVDYENALLGSAIVGAAGGVIGFLVGVIRDASAKKRFDFTSMSAEEKARAVRKIMGLPTGR